VNLRLRRATLDDAKRLYEWRTDPVTEANSLTPGPATFFEHEQWLRRVLANDRVALFIAEDADVAVGTGRLDIDGSRAEISVTVAPEARTRGVGTTIIDLLVEEARRRRLRQVTARVKGSNVASLRAFLNVRFTPENGVLFLERRL
jgi:RimJ/RimL family protein N-acetyltransferase